MDEIIIIVDENDLVVDEIIIIHDDNSAGDVLLDFRGFYFNSGGIYFIYARVKKGAKGA